jgi:hypothetical protein
LATGAKFLCLILLPLLLLLIIAAAAGTWLTPASHPFEADPNRWVKFQFDVLLVAMLAGVPVAVSSYIVALLSARYLERIRLALAVKLAAAVAIVAAVTFALISWVFARDIVDMEAIFLWNWLGIFAPVFLTQWLVLTRETHRAA